MPAKTILACLTSAEDATPVLNAACALAEQNHAHLIGIHTLETLVVYPGVAMHVPTGVFESYSEGQQAVADQLGQMFEAATEGRSFVSEWRCLKTHSTTASERVIESARAADLVVMAQADPANDRADQTDLQADVIRQAGCPVLVVPHGYEGVSNLGARVVFGWSNTRESARAAHDLVALFPDAEVTLLSANRKTPDEMHAYPANAMAEFLSRHGLETMVSHRDLAGVSVADVLRQEALRVGATCIVVGGFGHSQIYDFVIGAASRMLLREATIPVLYSK